MEVCGDKSEITLSERTTVPRPDFVLGVGVSIHVAVHERTCGISAQGPRKRFLGSVRDHAHDGVLWCQVGVVEGAC